MPIIQEKFWVVKCDSCGKYLDTTGDWDMQVWNTEDDAKQALGENGYWSIEEGSEHVTCEECLDEKYHKKDYLYD